MVIITARRRNEVFIMIPSLNERKYTIPGVVCKECDEKPVYQKSIIKVKRTCKQRFPLPVKTPDDGNLGLSTYDTI
jgi:hypothetical protein